MSQILRNYHSSITWMKYVQEVVFHYDMFITCGMNRESYHKFRIITKNVVHSVRKEIKRLKKESWTPSIQAVISNLKYQANYIDCLRILAKFDSSKSNLNKRSLDFVDDRSQRNINVYLTQFRRQFIGDQQGEREIVRDTLLGHLDIQHARIRSLLG